jgi:hypothetical protein
VAAGFVFAGIFALFVFVRLAATDKFDIERWLYPCGFKQRYGLPCPSCGMTTSTLAFARGSILESFYIQPAGALICSVLLITAFFAFLIAVFGLYFCFLRRLYAEVKLRYVVAALIIVVAAGWLVTLARALATR